MQTHTLRVNKALPEVATKRTKRPNNVLKEVNLRVAGNCIFHCTLKHVFLRMRDRIQHRGSDEAATWCDTSDVLQ